MRMDKECEKQNVPPRDMRAQAPPIWSQINWERAERYVRHLQGRIVKAQQEKRYAKVKSLSRILTRSFHAKALAVRQVTRSKGSRTAGIDGITWKSNDSKAQAILELQQHRYRVTSTGTTLYLKSQWQEATTGNPHHERQSNASAIRTRIVTDCGNNGRLSFLRVSSVPQLSGCHRSDQ